MDLFKLVTISTDGTNASTLSAIYTSGVIHGSVFIKADWNASFGPLALQVPMFELYREWKLRPGEGSKEYIIHFDSSL